MGSDHDQKDMDIDTSVLASKPPINGPVPASSSPDPDTPIARTGTAWPSVNAHSLLLQSERNLLEGDSKTGLDNADSALYIARQSENSDVLLPALLLAGQHLTVLSRYSDALLRLREAMSVAANSPPVVRAQVLGEHAALYLAVGAYARAFSDLAQARREAGEQDSLVLARVTELIGRCRLRLGAHDDAMQQYVEALAIRQRLGLPLADTINAIGLVFLARGNQHKAADPTAAEQDFQQAAAAFLRAIDSAEAVNDRRAVSLAVANLAAARGSLGSLAEAEMLYRQHVRNMRQLGDRSNEALGLTNLGEALRRRGRLPEARAVLIEALSLSNTLGAIPRQRSAHRELSVVYEMERDFENALGHQRHFHELEQGLWMEKMEARTALSSLELELDRVSKEAADFRHRLEEAEGEHSRLAQRIRKLDAQAKEDSLSRLPNRRHIDEQLPTLLAQCIERSLPLSLAFVDIDSFKQINDGYSHMVGDEVIRRVATTLSRLSRPTDWVGRFGGDEFLLALPGANLASAVQVCERIRAAVALEPWETLATGLKVTLSIGVASSQDNHDLATLLAAADLRLYKAKSAGRDQVAY
jgi:diguanylate cyclase (GGDEF)-like protein